jgi:tRNA-specific 2-thiouridylase
MRQKIIVGMSGGVDSAVAALRLLEQGHDVTGLFMKNWEEDDDNGQCTATADLADARQVCDSLGIDLKTVNFSAEYWDDVFEVFLGEYQRGRTPNPDILCNEHIKFRAFLDFACDLGAERVATGHYARISGDNGRWRLHKGLDENKDQSYFLYTLSQQQLALSLFPLGEMTKAEVRAAATHAGFANHSKKDSTGICFIGERRFRPFLQRFLPRQPGNMETPEGRVVGRHEGLMYYTLGQRQGLGVGGIRGAGGEPWYVLDKDLERNVLIVGQGGNHPRLFHNALEASGLHWTGGQALASRLRCAAKTRYRQPDQLCTAEPVSEDLCRVVFERPQRAITPGQSVVFYRAGECLGGGVIERVSDVERSAPILPAGAERCTA